MYFNSTLTDSSKLLKPLLVFSFIICAIICGLTRIIQYKNHAIDVYLGFLLGGAIAVYLVPVRFMCSVLKGTVHRGTNQFDSAHRVCMLWVTSSPARTQAPPPPLCCTAPPALCPTSARRRCFTTCR